MTARRKSYFLLGEAFDTIADDVDAFDLLASLLQVSRLCGSREGRYTSFVTSIEF